MNPYAFLLGDVVRILGTGPHAKKKGPVLAIRLQEGVVQYGVQVPNMGGLYYYQADRLKKV